MNAQNLKGNGWTARNAGQVYILSIENHSSIIEALTDFVIRNRIPAGEIHGIGAVSEATLRFFDPESKQYADKTFREQLEVTNLSGNISEADGKPLLHLHVTLGRKDYTSLAGHLLDARIRGAGEFFIYPLNSRLIKRKNAAVGLYFYDFDQE